MPEAAMSPYEHYCEAERLLNQVESTKYGGWELARLDIRLAQIHATLATVSTEVGSKASVSVAAQRKQKEDE